MERAYATVGYVGLLFGMFCAYWGQASGRNAWGWFFFGLFLAPLAGAVLLHLNAKDSPQ